MIKKKTRVEKKIIFFQSFPVTFLIWHQVQTVFNVSWHISKYLSAVAAVTQCCRCVTMASSLHAQVFRTSGSSRSSPASTSPLHTHCCAFVDVAVPCFSPSEGYFLPSFGGHHGNCWLSNQRKCLCSRQQQQQRWEGRQSCLFVCFARYQLPDGWIASWDTSAMCSLLFFFRFFWDAETIYRWEARLLRISKVLQPIQNHMPHQGPTSCSRAILLQQQQQEVAG